MAADSDDRFVVVELKAGVADRTALGQILPYIGWLREHLAKGGTVPGIVVASEFAPELIVAIHIVANLTLYRYAVTFSFTLVARPVPVSK